MGESLSSYTTEEWLDHLSAMLLWQFITPVRYALRAEEPGAIARATEAYSSPTGVATIHATIEGTAAFEPYVHALLDWASRLGDLDVDEQVPALPIPESE